MHYNALPHTAAHTHTLPNTSHTVTQLSHTATYTATNCRTVPPHVVLETVTPTQRDRVQDIDTPTESEIQQRQGQTQTLRQKLRERPKQRQRQKQIRRQSLRQKPKDRDGKHPLMHVKHIRVHVGAHGS